MAYVLARRAKAQDWFNGVMLGGEQQIEFHHIFPKAILRKKYDLQKDSRTVDQVANLAFLSRGANNRIGDREPSEYLTSVDSQRLTAQLVPLNSDLWTLEHFEDFVQERRTMLADAINNLLVSLTGEASIWVVSDAEALETRVNAVEEQIRELIAARLTAAQGDYAWEHLVPSDIRDTVRSRVEQSAKKNPFEQDRYTNLNVKLEQCQFSDYAKIIMANWSLFQDVFGTQQRFDQHIRAVTDARNALKHRRSFPRYERALAEGGLLWLEEAIQAAVLRDAAEDDEDELAG
jgi:hypothetical protein